MGGFVNQTDLQGETERALRAACCEGCKIKLPLDETGKYHPETDEYAEYECTYNPKLLPLFNAGMAGAYAAAAKEAGRVQVLPPGASQRTIRDTILDIKKRILALTPADARQAQSSERMECGHLKADWVEHQGTYSLAESGLNTGMWVCSCGTVLGDQPIDEIDSFFNAHASTSDYCRTCAAIASAEARGVRKASEALAVDWEKREPASGAWLGRAKHAAVLLENLATEIEAAARTPDSTKEPE